MITPLIVKLLLFLIVAHIICDFQLQGTAMSQAKNHKTGLVGPPNLPWWIAMGAHGLIHGAAVVWLTGSLMLGAIEIALHCFIDYVKNDGWISFRTDQILHVALKVVYVGIVATGVKLL